MGRGCGKGTGRGGGKGGKAKCPCQVGDFCGCTDLKTGCIVVGSVALFFALLFLIIGILIFYYAMPKDLEIAMYIFGALDILLSLLMIAFSIMLLVGVIKGNKKLVKPWPYGGLAYVIMRGIMLILFIVYLAYMDVVGWAIFAVIANAIYLGFGIYSVILVCSYM